MKKIIRKNRTKRVKTNDHNSEFYLQNAFENVAGTTGYLATSLQTKRYIAPEMISAMKVLLKDAIKNLDKAKKVSNENS